MANPSSKTVLTATVSQAMGMSADTNLETAHWRCAELCTGFNGACTGLNDSALFLSPASYNFAADGCGNSGIHLLKPSSDYVACKTKIALLNLFGTIQFSLVIRPGVMVPGVTYHFELAASDTVGAEGTASVSIMVNRPPRAGSILCANMDNPHADVADAATICSGTGGVDKFEFRAGDWSDEDSPLKFLFSATDIAVAMGAGATVAGAAFRALQPDWSYSNSAVAKLAGSTGSGSVKTLVRVRVADVYGAASGIDAGVELLPKPVLSIEAQEAAQAEATADIAGLLVEARGGEALMAITLSAAALNQLDSRRRLAQSVSDSEGSSSAGNSSRSSQSSFRARLLNSTISTRRMLELSVEAVEAQARVAQLLSDDPAGDLQVGEHLAVLGLVAEMSGDLQLATASAVGSDSGTGASVGGGGGGGNGGSSIAGVAPVLMTEALSNLVDRGLLNGMRATANDTLALIHAALGNITAAQLADHAADEEPEHVVSASIQLSAQKLSAWRLEEGSAFQLPSTSKDGVGAKFSLPPGLSAELELGAFAGVGAGAVQMQGVRWTSDPFTDADVNLGEAGKSAQLQSAVSSLLLRTDGGSEIEVQNLSKPLAIDLEMLKLPTDLILANALKANGASANLSSNSPPASSLGSPFLARRKTVVCEPHFAGNVTAAGCPAFSADGAYSGNVVYECPGNNSQALEVVLKCDRVAVECVWWDSGAAAGEGGWSTEGCQWAHRNSTVQRCMCNHLTDFSTRLRRVGGRAERVINANFLNEIQDSPLALAMFLSAYSLFVLLFVAAKRRDDQNERARFADIQRLVVASSAERQEELALLGFVSDRDVAAQVASRQMSLHDLLKSYERELGDALKSVVQLSRVSNRSNVVGGSAAESTVVTHTPRSASANEEENDGKEAHGGADLEYGLAYDRQHKEKLLVTERQRAKELGLQLTRGYRTLQTVSGFQRH